MDSGSLVDAHVLLVARLVPLVLATERFVFVREHKLVWQVILIEVVDEIPEALLVLLFIPQVIQLNLEVQLVVEQVADVFEQTSRTQKARLHGLAACTVLLVTTSQSCIRPVDHLTNCHP